jgi:hypothetical protein
VAQETGHSWALVERILASQERLWSMKFNKWLYTSTCCLDQHVRAMAGLHLSAFNTGRE